MQAIDVDAKINSFLQRKEEKLPSMLTGREAMRTVKYARSLRTSGQILFSR